MIQPAYGVQPDYDYWKSPPLTALPLACSFRDRLFEEYMKQIQLDAMTYTLDPVAGLRARTDPYVDK